MEERWVLWLLLQQPLALLLLCLTGTTGACWIAAAIAPGVLIDSKNYVMLENDIIANVSALVTLCKWRYTIEGAFNPKRPKQAVIAALVAIGLAAMFGWSSFVLQLTTGK
jgi:hypothetical protein